MSERPTTDPKLVVIDLFDDGWRALDARLDGDHGLFAAVYPVYHQHFSQEEIEAMVAFYRTPAGSKALQVMPQVTMQSMQATQRWAQSVSHAVQIRIEQRLAAEGLR